MDWKKATDSELLTVMAHDTMARASDIIGAREEYLDRHPPPLPNGVLEQKIKRRPAR
ncbi:hypothetical protein ACFSR7_35850 [Cohnella sp. GCM10020058]|uniref:hypothetical protein n=1 Tax=Cohnella sp. GCM10020058 TaxID=3317330 RepID=UPI003629F6A1